MGPTSGAHSLAGCLWGWTPWLGAIGGWVARQTGGTTGGRSPTLLDLTIFNAWAGSARGHVRLGLVLNIFNAGPGCARGYVRCCRFAMLVVCYIRGPFAASA